MLSHISVKNSNELKLYRKCLLTYVKVNVNRKTEDDHMLEVRNDIYK